MVRMSEYRSENNNLVEWYQNNKLALNASKTNELIFHQEGKTEVSLHLSSLVGWQYRESTASGSFMHRSPMIYPGPSIMMQLQNKTRQHLYCLRILRRFGIVLNTLVIYYRWRAYSLATLQIMTSPPLTGSTGVDH